MSVRKGKGHRSAKSGENKERIPQAQGIQAESPGLWCYLSSELPRKTPRVRPLGPQGVEAQQQLENNCGHHSDRGFLRGGRNRTAQVCAQKPLGECSHSVLRSFGLSLTRLDPPSWYIYPQDDISTPYKLLFYSTPPLRSSLPSSRSLWTDQSCSRLATPLFIHPLSI